jgi:hypothetical protein
MALPPNGRIVVAGQLWDDNNTNFGIARVLG